MAPKTRSTAPERCSLPVRGSTLRRDNRRCERLGRTSSLTGGARTEPRVLPRAALVSEVGPSLSAPSPPDRFAGRASHKSQWPGKLDAHETTSAGGRGGGGHGGGPGAACFAPRLVRLACSAFSHSGGLGRSRRSGMGASDPPKTRGGQAPSKPSGVVACAPGPRGVALRRRGLSLQHRPGGGGHWGAPYVERRVDADLHVALQQGEFIVLAGPSKSGKSRTAFEALRKTLPDASLLVPVPPSQAAAPALFPSWPRSRPCGSFPADAWWCGSMTPGRICAAGISPPPCCAVCGRPIRASPS